MAFDPDAYLASITPTQSTLTPEQTLTGIPGGPADMVSATGGNPTPRSRYQQDVIALAREKSRPGMTEAQRVAYADAERMLAGRANGEGGAPFREDGGSFDPDAYIASLTANAASSRTVSATCVKVVIRLVAGLASHSGSTCGK